MGNPLESLDLEDASRFGPEIAGHAGQRRQSIEVAGSLIVAAVGQGETDSRQWQDLGGRLGLGVEDIYLAQTALLGVDAMRYSATGFSLVEGSAAADSPRDVAVQGYVRDGLLALQTCEQTLEAGAASVRALLEGPGN